MGWKMELGNKKHGIFLIVLILLLGLAGITLANDINALGDGNGDVNREKSVRIQDVEIWFEDAKKETKEGYIAYEHYANVPFNIYLFVTNPGQVQNIPVGESTTFILTLLGPNGEKLPIGPGPVTLEENGQATVSTPLEVTIPYGGNWKIAVQTNNENYHQGGGNDGGSDGGTQQIVVEVPIMTKPATAAALEITPANAMINIGESTEFTVRLKDTASGNTIYTVGNQWTLTPSSEIASRTGSLVSIEDNRKDPAQIDRVYSWKQTFQGISPGVTTITAKYGGYTATATLTVSGAPHHLAVVPMHVGEPSSPQLNIRSTTGPSESTWGYIGEPMTINVALQMQDISNQGVADYAWDKTWFSDPAHWGIQFSSESGVLDPSKYETSVLYVGVDSLDPSVLKATLQIRLKQPSTQGEFKDIQVLINPEDVTRIHLTAPSKAVVFSASGSPNAGPYNLFGGRIRVADNYFNSSTGNANVFVEIYRNGSFVTNTEDSKTSVDKWMFDGNVLNNAVTFIQGKAQVPVSSNQSNKVKILAPRNGSYPDYLQIQSGTLTWGQIVNNPPASGGGTLWETEIIPGIP